MYIGKSGLMISAVCALLVAAPASSKFLGTTAAYAHGGDGHGDGDHSGRGGDLAGGGGSDRDGDRGERRGHRDFADRGDRHGQHSHHAFADRDGRRGERGHHAFADRDGRRGERGHHAFADRDGRHGERNRHAFADRDDRREGHHERLHDRHGVVADNHHRGASALGGLNAAHASATARAHAAPGSRVGTIAAFANGTEPLAGNKALTPEVAESVDHLVAERAQ